MRFGPILLALDHELIPRAPKQITREIPDILANRAVLRILVKWIGIAQDIPKNPILLLDPERALRSAPGRNLVEIRPIQLKGQPKLLQITAANRLLPLLLCAR